MANQMTYDRATLKNVADTLRVLSMEAVQKANSGHPGMPMGMADVAAVLWSSFLRFDPKAPDWPNRDRFVLSAGHGSMLLYSLLHLSGYDLSMDDIKQFRQWGSKTAGHPEYGHAPGIETTTGPLGQGIATAVGMALTERWLASRFNTNDQTLIDYRTYVIAGDGDLMEGISHEACSLAGHLGLGRLIVLYDDNGISIDGPTSLSFSEDVIKRYQSYGWHVERVDGHDTDQVAASIERAIAENDQPSLIACRTTIGFGSPNRAGSSKAHGEPLGSEEIELVKKALGWSAEGSFQVHPDASRILGASADRGRHAHNIWQSTLSQYRQNAAESYNQWSRIQEGSLPQEAFHFDSLGFSNAIATRAASGRVLDHICEAVPEMLGGSADLTGSNKTKTSAQTAVSKGNYGGQYVYFGVREHAMAAMMNGMALSKAAIPYGGTFLVFADYMRPSMRLAALMGLRVIYVFTHDSIGLGEDGPTHQPIEHLASLRAMPNLNVIRPADAWETAGAWRCALENRGGPTALVLTRQKLPVLDPGTADQVSSGAYVLDDAPDPKAVIMATGSEVHIAMEAKQALDDQGIPTRVVSMPCWELFEAAEPSYRNTVLPDDIKVRVAIEAGCSMGWEKYVGPNGEVIAINRFGASAPCEVLYKNYGLTADAVVDAVLRQQP